MHQKVLMINNMQVVLTIVLILTIILIVVRPHTANRHCRGIGGAGSVIRVLVPSTSWTCNRPIWGVGVGPITVSAPVSLSVSVVVAVVTTQCGRGRVSGWMSGGEGEGEGVWKGRSEKEGGGKEGGVWVSGGGRVDGERGGEREGTSARERECIYHTAHTT